MKRLFVGLFILSVVEGVGLVSPSVYAAVGNVIIDQSVTGSITAQNVTGVKFIDSANSSYFLDPAATGNALTTAGAAGIGTTGPGSRLEIKGAGATSSTSGLNVTNSGGTSALYVRDDGYVGIGLTTPTFSTARFEQTATFTDAATDSNVHLQTLMAATGANVGGTSRGTTIRTLTSGTYNYTGTLRALEGAIWNNGSGTITNAIGFLFSGGTFSTGNITDLKAVRLENYSLGGGGTVGTMTGLSIGNLSAYNSPTTVYGINIDANTTANGTSKYGILIGNISGAATNNYSIYTGTAQSYFGGNVGIGTTAPGAALQIGTAGTSTGVIRLTGSTSGYVEISSRAIGGSWTMNLPQGVGTAGYQLTDAAGNGNTSWAAAGSVRSMKNISGLFGNPNDALTTLLDTNVYRFHYKPEMGTGDSTTEYVGVVADEAPWAVHYNGTVVNPVNTLGYMVLGIQALDKKIDTRIKDQQDEIDQLKADNEALKHKVSDYDELKARLHRLEIMVNAEPQ